MCDDKKIQSKKNISDEMLLIIASLAIESILLPIMW
jgi:hypothetical protein